MTEYALIEDGKVVQIGLPQNWKNITRLDLADEKTLQKLGWLPITKTTVEPQDGFKILEEIEISKTSVNITQKLVEMTAEELAVCQANKPTYKELRAKEYPELGVVIDAICKAMDGDNSEYQEIQAGRLAIKAKYPKVSE